VVVYLVHGTGETEKYFDQGGYQVLFDIFMEDQGALEIENRNIIYHNTSVRAYTCKKTTGGTAVACQSSMLKQYPLCTWLAEHGGREELTLITVLNWVTTAVAERSCPFIGGMLTVGHDNPTLDIAVLDFYMVV
jgi:hypothetical protein